MKKLFRDDETVLIKNPSDLYYFSEIKNEDAFIFFYEGQSYYFTDARYFEDVTEKLPEWTIKDANELFDFILNAKIVKLGIEDDLSHTIREKLSAECNISEFYSVNNVIRDARAIKSEKEIKYIKKAQEITDKTFKDLLPLIREGITETELAGTLESLLYVNGADDLAFTSIVAFNENSSMPHAIRTEKKLENQSIITLDFGANYHNYCSDMTRTIFFGEPNDEYKKIYNLVLTAQEMAIGISFSGIKAKECDMIARKYFKENDLDKYFLHTLGHGVGIDIHEYPTLSQKCDAIMQDNMIVTVEPGLYFEKKFGVRIEDMIIFNKSGVINLTKSPKNMIIL